MMSKFEENLMKTEGMTDEKLSDPCYNSDLEMKTIDYDPNGTPNSEKARAQAAVEGLEVVYPQGNQLFIDIDNEHNYRLFNNQLSLVQKFIGYADRKETPSKSGHAWKMHITLTFGPNIAFTAIERLALQAMLGSDRVREILGYIEYKNGDPTPVLFLEKKPKLLNASLESNLDILTDEEIPY
jgi:hypothetical protein